MPEFRLESEQESTRKKLSEVPAYEVWEDVSGDAVWRDCSDDVLAVLGTGSGRIFRADSKPDEITVVRKICDPIVLRFNSTQE